MKKRRPQRTSHSLNLGVYNAIRDSCAKRAPSRYGRRDPSLRRPNLTVAPPRHCSYFPPIASSLRCLFVKPRRLLLRVKQARIVLQPEVGARHVHQRLDLVHRLQRTLGIHIE